MKAKPGPLEATVIGSWSFPGWYEKLTRDAESDPGLFGADDLREMVEDATRLAVRDQVEAGLDRITDGEMTRVDFNLGFYDFLEGLERIPAGRRWGAPAHDQRSKYRCVGELRAPRGLGTVEEFERLRRIAGPGTRLKAAVPGPFTLAGCIDGGRIHAGRAEVASALVPIVNRELRDLVAAGADFIQLDEPSFACHPSRPGEFGEVVARTTEGVDAYVSMHMCFGNYRARAVGRRSYAELFPHMGGWAVDQVALEFASREMSEWERTSELPERMSVAAGLVDVKNTWIESPELVADRLRLLVSRLGPERVSVTPDCGFSQTARHVAVRKARAMAEGVRIVRRELGLESGREGEGAR